MPFSQSQKTTELYEHHETITCIAIDKMESYFVTGSTDGLVIFWGIVHDRIVAQNKIYDFNSPITDISISGDSLIVAVASLEGKINLYNLVDGEKIRTIYHPGLKRIDKVAIGLYPYGTVVFYNESERKIYVYSINGQVLVVKQMKSEKIIDMHIASDTSQMDFLVRDYAEYHQPRFIAQMMGSLLSPICHFWRKLRRTDRPRLPG